MRLLAVILALFLFGGTAHAQALGQSGSNTPRPNTSGGLTVSSPSLGATVTSVKSSGGQIYGWYIYNSNTSAIYVQWFNAATGSVTLGTTVPNMTFGIPAGAAANVFTDVGIPFGTAITIAVTTTRGGATGPTNVVDCNIFYN